MHYGSSSPSTSMGMSTMLISGAVVFFRQKYRRGEVNSGYSVNSGGDELNEPYRVNKVDR